MLGYAPSLTPFQHITRISLFNPLSEIQSQFLVPISRIGYGYGSNSKQDVCTPLRFSHSCSYRNYCYFKEPRNYRCIIVKASRKESPHEVLGVSPSATPNEIKRAYRKLALKFHPDVNKEANAQEKFMRIKHAYNILLSKSERRFHNGNRGTESSYSTAGRSQSSPSEDNEEFYGFGDLFKDLQEEFQNWEAGAGSQGKPKSLWEELAEIGEEFVEFLERELNIADVEAEETKDEQPQKGNASYGSEAAAGGSQTDTYKSGIEENIDDIEVTLAQLKKELGL